MYEYYIAVKYWNLCAAFVFVFSALQVQKIETYKYILYM